MKQYLKTHENIFSTDKKKDNNPLNLDVISAGGMDLNEYIYFCKKFFKEAYNSQIFDVCVRFAWLRRKFRCNNEKVGSQIKNSLYFNVVFLKLMRRNIGIDPHVIMYSGFFKALESYFDSFFQGFDDGNPFENPEYYKFPFENISIDFLVVVYQLDDRIDLLRMADEKKMSYAVFADYAINHALSINESLAEPIYEIYDNSKHAKHGRGLFFIKDIRK